MNLITKLKTAWKIRLRKDKTKRNHLLIKYPSMKILTHWKALMLPPGMWLKSMLSLIQWIKSRKNVKFAKTWMNGKWSKWYKKKVKSVTVQTKVNNVTVKRKKNANQTAQRDSLLEQKSGAEETTKKILMFNLLSLWDQSKLNVSRDSWNMDRV